MTMTAEMTEAEPTEARAPLDNNRLWALREHAVWLEQIAGEAGPYRPRQVHAGELRAYADAARDLVNEVIRLRGDAAALPCTCGDDAR